MWLIRSSRRLNQAAFEAPQLSHTRGTEVCGPVEDQSRIYTPVFSIEYTYSSALHTRGEWILLKLLKYSNISYTNTGFIYNLKSEIFQDVFRILRLKFVFSIINYWKSNELGDKMFNFAINQDLTVADVEMRCYLQQFPEVGTAG